MAKILILGGNTTSGDLILSDNGYTGAKKGEDIKWKIKDDDDPVVKSIVSIRLKDGTNDIFSGTDGESPNKEDDKKWKAKIAKDVSAGDICNYSIEWKDDKGNRHLYDPIITIMPSLSPVMLFVFSILSILGLTYFIHLFLKRTKR